MGIKKFHCSVRSPSPLYMHDLAALMIEIH